MTRRRYCTYFDINYLPRGLALYESLRATSGDFTLDVLCLDDQTPAELERRALPGVRLTRLADLESAVPDLLATKSTRSRVEYIFTSGPAFMRHVLDTSPDVDLLTYLDSDLCFFSTPEPLFAEAEAAGASTVIVGHRFPYRLRHLEEHGRYNVAWVSFRRDADGFACLDYWRSACLEWCHDRVEDGRYADQGYLDEFPRRFAGVHELRHPGADVAPWNLSDPPLEWDGSRFLVGGRELVFFHFQGLKRPWRWVVDLHLEPYGQRATPVVRRLYARYLDALADQPGGGNLRSARTARPPVRFRALASARGILSRTSALHVAGRLL